mmetsp:Transcript_13651/g.19294  ORF Transcript_13651/g.19294 Transcript_13651/m.19294 type:complete len:239 (-) Transcript_13651:344-1060(-)
MISPSACTTVRNLSSQKHSIMLKCELIPRSRTTSFKAWYVLLDFPLRVIMAHSLILRLIFTPSFPSTTLLTSLFKFPNSNGVRNPMLPMLKHRCGGAGPSKSVLECISSPSPPRVSTKSAGGLLGVSAAAAVEGSSSSSSSKPLLKSSSLYVETYFPFFGGWKSRISLPFPVGRLFFSFRYSSIAPSIEFRKFFSTKTSSCISLCKKSITFAPNLINFSSGFSKTKTLFGLSSHSSIF